LGQVSAKNCVMQEPRFLAPAHIVGVDDRWSKQLREPNLHNGRIFFVQTLFVFSIHAFVYNQLYENFLLIIVFKRFVIDVFKSDSEKDWCSFNDELLDKYVVYIYLHTIGVELMEAVIWSV
jgi:hypothetical protein